MRGRTLLAWTKGWASPRLHARSHFAARSMPDFRLYGVLYQEDKMTSEERHEARYRRRKAKREAKRLEKESGYLCFDDVITFMRLYRSALACYRNVGWKASVQSYRARAGINVYRRLQELRRGKFRLRSCQEFYIRERGHERKISSIHIEDRIPQKCLCRYSLKQVIHRSLIYDNYASQERKGTELARKRLKCHLERHIRRHGMTGGMIIFDFKGFFDSVRHDLVRSVLERYYEDEWLIGMNMRIVKQARSDIGLVLGSENSQDFAIATPNSLDHYIKEVLRLEAYGRYMDDGWIIHPDFAYLKESYNRIREYAAGLGFTLNERKTQVIRFGRQFTMMKRKYSFTPTGKIIIRPVRQSVIRERRKLKKLYRRSLNGTMRTEAGLASLESWRSSLRGCRCRKIVKSMEELYNSLYIEPWLNGQEGLCTTKSYPEV